MRSYRSNKICTHHIIAAVIQHNMMSRTTVILLPRVDSKRQTSCTCREGALAYFLHVNAFSLMGRHVEPHTADGS